MQCMCTIAGLLAYILRQTPRLACPLLLPVGSRARATAGAIGVHLSLLTPAVTHADGGHAWQCNAGVFLPPEAAPGAGSGTTAIHLAQERWGGGSSQVAWHGLRSLPLPFATITMAAVALNACPVASSVVLTSFVRPVAVAATCQVRVPEQGALQPRGVNTTRDYVSQHFCAPCCHRPFLE